MAVKITPKVSQRARSLLKWNVNDLSKESNVPPKVIERFERGMGQMQRPDNDAIFKTFKEHGIRIKDNLEVELVDKKSGKKSNSGPVRAHIKLVQTKYTADDMESLVASYFESKQKQDENR